MKFSTFVKEYGLYMLLTLLMLHIIRELIPGDQRVLEGIVTFIACVVVVAIILGVSSVIRKRQK